jgi:hypothetical protein
MLVTSLTAEAAREVTVSDGSHTVLIAVANMQVKDMGGPWVTNKMMTVNGPSIGLTDIETLPNTKESETT